MSDAAFIAETEEGVDRGCRRRPERRRWWRKRRREKGWSRQIAVGTNKSVSSRRTRRGEFRVNCFPVLFLHPLCSFFLSLVLPMLVLLFGYSSDRLEKRLSVSSNRRLKFRVSSPLRPHGVHPPRSLALRLSLPLLLFSLSLSLLETAILNRAMTQLHWFISAYFSSLPPNLLE